MRATRRRQRKVDPLASPAAVRSVNEQLRAALPDLIPSKDRELVRLLRAARHAQRYPATDTKRGRPGTWRREDLLGVVARLEDILGRETSSHTSSAGSVDHYLRLPDFPPDVEDFDPVRLYAPVPGATHTTRFRSQRDSTRGRDG